MDTPNFDPTAASYHKRLDVPPESDPEQIEQAGRAAFNKYTKRESFSRIKQARTVLQTDSLRQAYQQFCDAFGAVNGTYEFEAWISDGRQLTVNERINQYQGDPQNSAVDRQELASELCEITQLTIKAEAPKVIWRNNTVQPGMYINLWQKHDRRLYINNFYESGDIYLDLEFGQFYTKDHESISDINWDVIEQGRQLYVTYGDRRLTIDFVEEASGDQPVRQDEQETPTHNPHPESLSGPKLNSTVSLVANRRSIKIIIAGLIAIFGVAYLFRAVSFWLNLSLVIS